jgi:thiol:disulfide interchange protein
VNSPFKPLFGVFVVIVAVAAVVGISRARRSDGRIPWRTDFAAAKAESKQSGKPMLLYFTASWCGPCQSLKRTTWDDAGVETALREYVPVKVDIDEQPDLAEQYRVQAVPMYVVVLSTGEQRETSGALAPAEFLRWLTLEK